MSQNVFDQAARYLAKLDRVPFLCWVLELQPADFVFRGWVDTRRLPFPGEPDRVNDTVAHLEDVAGGNVPWAVVLEFQLEPEPLMFGRMLVYEGQVWLEKKPSDLPGDRFNMGAVVINLTGRGHCGREMDWPRAKLKTILEPREINLCDRQAQTVMDGIVAGTVPRVILPLIPLMQGGDDAGIIQLWLAQASLEADNRRRGDYGGLALVFAEAAKCADVWKTALKGWNVVQSQQVLEWQAEARAEALVDSTVAHILRLLEIRFQQIPADLANVLRGTTDLAKLQTYFDLAVSAVSIDGFRQSAGL